MHWQELTRLPGTFALKACITAPTLAAAPAAHNRLETEDWPAARAYPDSLTVFSPALKIFIRTIVVDRRGGAMWAHQPDDSCLSVPFAPFPPALPVAPAIESRAVPQRCPSQTVA